jgi:hypothetical protein
MNTRLVILFILLVTSGCQNVGRSPDEVSAALAQREQGWRAFVSEKYDLTALTAFLKQTVTEWKILGELDLSNQHYAPVWTVDGSTMTSGQWYFNAWDRTSDSFTLHTTMKKRVTFHCFRVSRTEFKVQKVTVEDLPNPIFSH